MGTSALMALIVVAVAAAPFAFNLMNVRMLVTGGILAFVGFFIVWWILYSSTPSTAGPFYGLAGIIVLIGWLITAAAGWVVREDDTDVNPWPASSVFIIGCIAFGLRGLAGSNMMAANEYATLAGRIEYRTWDHDVQPLNPEHIRLVSPEQAMNVARRKLGDATGAVGSQFEVAETNLTLQRVAGHMDYVVPLDFRSYTTWDSAGVSPGYIVVDAENPMHPPLLVQGRHMAFMPNAYFNHNLQRHLWTNGYSGFDLSDWTFELDDAGRAWWVITATQPTIGWWGDRVRGVILVDPESGSHRFYRPSDIPRWVDRVVPRAIVLQNLRGWGTLRGGWWNGVWAKSGLLQPEESPMLVYGADGDCYWATPLTSTNENDHSMVWMAYVDSHTGRTRLYRTSGSTEDKVIEAANTRVAIYHYHAATPVLENLRGTMAAIVPINSDDHSFRGVVITNMQNTQQIVFAETPAEAVRLYEELLVVPGGGMQADVNHTVVTLIRPVIRIADEVTNGRTRYSVIVQDSNGIFTGTSDLSPELPLTQPGDQVELTYVESADRVSPMRTFDNRALFSPPAR